MAGFVSARAGEKPVGVYALYDAKRNLQYVGYARNVVLAVKVGESFVFWLKNKRQAVFGWHGMQAGK